MTTEKDNSLSKQEAIEQLHQTIGQLENIIQQLNKTSVIDLPSSTTIKNLIITTTQLENIISERSKESEIKENISKNIEEKIEDSFFKVESQIKQNNQDQSLLSEEKKEEKIVVQSNVQQVKKNNYRWIVIGAIAIIILIAIPLSWKLFFSEQVPQLIAEKTDITVLQENEDTNTVPNVDLEENQILVNEDHSSAQKEISKTDTKLTTKIPPELIAENRPQKVAIETINPSLKLTPEQNLVGALDNKVHNFIARYDEDIILAIKPNFADGVLTVTVTDDWYQLLANSQDKIAGEIFKKSRQLEFKKLIIDDLQDNLIARSPVVGQSVIILRRTI